MEEVEGGEGEEKRSVGIEVGVKCVGVCCEGGSLEKGKKLERRVDRVGMVEKGVRGKEKGWGKGEKGGVKIGGVEEDIWKWGKDKVEKIRDRVREEREVGRMCMEDLKVKGMEGKDDVGEGVVDGWFGMLVRMVEYKWRWYGNNRDKEDKIG